MPDNRCIRGTPTEGNRVFSCQREFEWPRHCSGIFRVFMQPRSAKLHLGAATEIVQM
jgi:hypothetical protein